MKRKSLLFLLLMALFMPWAAMAQETLTVHDGTTTNGNVPIWGLWADNSLQSEMVYPATELEDMNGGTISILNVFSNGTNNIPSTGTSGCWNGTCQIFMKEVSETTISDFTGTDGATIVYDGPISLVSGVMTIELSTPYTYGGGNLLVGYYYTTGGAYASVSWKGESVTGAAVYGRSGQSYSPTVANFLPKTTFTYVPASTGCDMPTAIAVSDITTDGATVTWEGEGNKWNLRYKASTDEEYTLVENLTAQTYTFEGTLAGNTTYNVGVQTVCTGSTSFFKSTSFTTANACAVPTNLQITNVTESSATLTWTPGYQETTWTVKYKKSSEAWDNAAQETVNGTPTLVLSNLDGLTTYNVQVYNCENYVSGNFTTAASIPLTEAFATTTIPTGWTRYNTLLTNDVLNGTTALTSYNGGWNFNTGNGVFDNHAKVNIYGSSCKYWLVTPALPMEDNVQLTFDMALTKYSGTLQEIDKTLGQDDRFVVLITTDGGTTWEILREWNNTGSEYVYNDIVCSAIGQAVAIDLSEYAGQNIAVAFYGESTVSETGSDNNLHIDNVSIDYIPSCAKPTGVAASDVTAHEATITWTSDATAWQVQLDDEDPIDVEETTYTFENLDPETTYTAKVRANCSGTYSEWTTAVSFTTTIACPAPTSLVVAPNGLSATFSWVSNAGEWEVAYATDATAVPAENIVGTVNEATYTINLELGDYYFWVRANCGDVDGYSQWAGPVSVHIGYCVPNPTSHDGSGITGVTFGMGDYVVENGGEGISIPATSPYYGDYSDMIGAVQAGVESTIAITTATGSYPYTFVIWVDFDNSLSFEDSEIVYIGKASSGAGTHEAKITVPADQALGDYRMRIYGADSYFNSFYNNGNTNWDASHDPCSSGSYRHANDYTLRVLEAPSCLIPTDLAINYTGGTEATISWTSDAEAWNMRVNGVDVEGTITNPYTLTGLELATTYSVEVQANCGEDGTSEWSNPVSFTTDLCLPEYMCAISYSFTDQYDDSWNGAYINIVDATTEKLLYELTMPSVTGPYEGSFNVCDGREIQFVWVSGNYPRECGYVFTHNGDTILEKTTNSTAPDAGVFFTYNVDCGFVTLTKDITGYGTGTGNYCLIASPVGTIDVANVDNLLENDFDLYYFDQSGEGDDTYDFLEWINYNQGEDEEPGFTQLEQNKGYLYANSEDVTLTFTGIAIDPEEVESVEVELDYDATANLPGLNLLGNPYAVNAIIDWEDYLVMEDGELGLAERGDYPYVNAMEGFFVEAEEAEQTVVFEPDTDGTTTGGGQNPGGGGGWSGKLNLRVSDNNGNGDLARIRFGQGHGLTKYMINPENTKIYFPMDNADYAVVYAENMGEMPVNFKASANGTYTLSFTNHNVEFGYLHLIDNMNGNDVDLLANPSYSFEASTTDYASRFKLVFATGNADDSFAFFSNGSFVISNEGNATLQVVDVTGRILKSETINGCANVNVNAAPGVYMLRLINGNNVKVQKVVVK